VDYTVDEHGWRDRYVIGPLSGTQIWLVAGFTDMRKGFAGLSALVQTQLEQDPYAGALYIFRGKSGDKIKILWADEDGVSLYYRRLHEGRFVWPQAIAGTVLLSSAQLSMLLEGIDWRKPKRTSTRDPDRSRPTRSV
jgi:transposase